MSWDDRVLTSHETADCPRKHSSVRQWYGALGISTLAHLLLIFVLGSCWMLIVTPEPVAEVNTRWQEPSLPHLQPVDPLEVPLTTSIVPADAERAIRPALSIPTPASEISLHEPASVVAALNEIHPIRQIESVTNHVSPGIMNGSNSAAPGENRVGQSVGQDGDSGFFGVTSDAMRYVFVVDASLSMNHPHPSPAKTRFNRVKLELVHAIGNLDGDMQFFIVFFNDVALPMPAGSLQSASSESQRRYLYWMQGIRAEGLSEPADALGIALRLQPDVIYFLTDGRFPLATQRRILDLPTQRTQIHTFTFEERVTEKMQAGMKLLESGNRKDARRLLKGNNFRVADELSRARVFLESLARKHDGEFHVIP